MPASGLTGRERQGSAALAFRIAGATPPLDAKDVLLAARIAGSVFLLQVLFCLGFLDGIPGLIYCGLQGVQFFHIKAKIYELKMQGMRRERA